MPRNRVIYQCQTLYAGPSPATGTQYSISGLNQAYAIKTAQLHRVQSINHGYNIARRDVNQFGELAAIDRIILDPPTINLDFSYLSSSFINEVNLGFYVNSGQGDRSCITYILDKTADERNYFIETSREGVDNVGDTTNSSAVSFVGIGNGFIANYTHQGAVGDFPRTNVTVEALNNSYETSLGSPSGVIYTGFRPNFDATGGNVINNPAVNPSDGSRVTGYVAIPTAYTNPFTGIQVGPYALSTLRPGDITFSLLDHSDGVSALNEAGPTISDAKIQSYSLTVALAREALAKLGSKYAFAREIRFPVQVTFRIEANIGDITTGNLVDVITADKSYDVSVLLKHPVTQITQMKYTLKNAKLESQEYTSSIGPNKAVTLNFAAQIGGPNQLSVGLFFSGVSGQSV